MKNENRWYRLDNAAKIYPAVTNSSHANVFRIAVRMKEIVKPQVLQEALNVTLPRFPSFDVRMQKGLFWYYFEHNPGKPVVSQEIAPICRPVLLEETNGYLFRVSYYDTRISLEVFHAVADGTGAAAFLKSLLYNYLSLDGKAVEAGDGVLNGEMYPVSSEVEDSFLKYYDATAKSSWAESKAYQISGTRIAPSSVRVTHGIIPITEYRLLTKKNNATVTEYTVALMIYAVYMTQLKGIGSKLPVKVSVPVNLRSFFPSETLRNFSSYVNLGLVFSAAPYTFNDILSIVSAQLKNDAQKDRLIEKVGANVSAERSPFMRLTPLVLKSIALKTAFRLYGERLVTSTMSNLGIIALPPSMTEHVERFEFVLGAPAKNMINCAVCSFAENLTITFTRVMEETDIERFFFRFLAGQGISVVIESNYGVEA
jgi:NRPS condensation-like uncharacterized protein